MIITKILGGLGNQMFQYALGKYLAQKHDTELKLDVTNFNNYKLHNYDLSKLNIQNNIALIHEIEKLKSKKFFNFIKIKKQSHINEKTFTFDESILDLPDNIYLEGYWQSEKYFKSLREILLQEFSPKDKITCKNEKYLSKISSVNSVSLHVRRGDYISNPTANSVHGTCNLDYYSKSIDYIVSKIEKPEFYIFSDDHQWVKENLKYNHPMTFVNWNTKETALWDMFLMSKCKHNIIANSTFSWWGAWLNDNNDKIVIAPKKWFNSSDMSGKDLVPTEWIGL